MIVEGHIGGRIKERRIMLGWTPEQLAAKAGLRPGTVSTAERGRALPAQMHEIAKALHVPVGYFYDGLNGETLPPLSGTDRMRLEMSRNFSRLPSEIHQRALNEFLKALVET